MSAREMTTIQVVEFSHVFKRDDFLEKSPVDVIFGANMTLLPNSRLATRTILPNFGSLYILLVGCCFAGSTNLVVTLLGSSGPTILNRPVSDWSAPSCFTPTILVAWRPA